MGWANCGTDSQGRPIGYAFETTCDHPECNAKIDRGVSYACGGMHGEDEISCEKYFCPKHLEIVVIKSSDECSIDGLKTVCLCRACVKLLLSEEDK